MSIRPSVCQSRITKNCSQDFSKAWYEVGGQQYTLNCDTPHHFANVCRQPKRDSAGAIIAHVRYSQSNDSFTSANTNRDIRFIPAKITPVANGKHLTTCTLVQSKYSQTVVLIYALQAQNTWKSWVSRQNTSTLAARRSQLSAGPH